MGYKAITENKTQAVLGLQRGSVPGGVVKKNDVK